MSACTGSMSACTARPRSLAFCLWWVEGGIERPLVCSPCTGQESARSRSMGPRNGDQHAVGIAAAQKGSHVRALFFGHDLLRCHQAVGHDPIRLHMDRPEQAELARLLQVLRQAGERVLELPSRQECLDPLDVQLRRGDASRRELVVLPEALGARARDELRDGGHAARVRMRSWP